MRALVQRVSSASVDVGGERISQIGPGLLVLLGVTHGDTGAEARWLADKVRALRVFDDADGRMNEPLGDRELLCVSQFTLYGDARRGNRPSYVDAAGPDHAEPLYELFCELTGAARGVFGAHMDVALINDGPVTLMLEKQAG
jgi:D-aminoacyl-tRNA deacylase